jgi:hypothetical protein
MNLKKYTKAELISKIKGLNNNNPGIQSKLFGFFYLIKHFLVKITFLALIIKVFKRFSLLRRLWLIINTIVMSIFGISMLDLYGLTFLSALFTEISFITGNIVNYLTNTKFYGIISGILGHKLDTPKTRMGAIDKSSAGNEEGNKIIERFTKIIHNEPEIEENTPLYRNKYFIWGSFLLISAVTYYYFGEEIKVYGFTFWNFLKGRRPDGGDGNNPENPQNRYNSWVNLIGWNENKTKNLNISEILDDGVGLVDTTNAIAGPSTEPMDDYFTKGKNTLTSPSLDNLNTTAQETWSESRPTSPQSTSSSGTITQANLTSNINSSSTNLFKHDEIPKSLIEKTVAKLDEAFSEDGHVKPFIGTSKHLKNITESNWLDFVNPGIKDRMNIIEKNINSGEIYSNRKIAENMVAEMEVINKSYDALVKFYENNKDRYSITKVIAIKNMSFHMRGWMLDYYPKMFPNEKLNIYKGFSFHSPKTMGRNIFEED